jgi:6-phosphofructokinase 1
MTHRDKLGILVGGGPAPGINAVIGAATIRARLESVEVIAIEDGFEWITQGDIDHVRRSPSRTRAAFTFAAVRPSASRAPIRRCRPNARDHRDVAAAARRHHADHDRRRRHCLLGDEARGEGGGRIRVVHVPKTIDNDLDLPPHVDSFGYQTARHIGVEILKNLMVDAKTTSRWYFVITMGRKAGHLALGSVRPPGRR